MKSYTTAEAKAKFSEVIRSVRGGQHVLITYHGETVAEVRPVEADEQTLDARLRSLETSGVLIPARSKAHQLQPVARRNGALQRFLESRD